MLPNNMIASGHDDNIIRIWNLSTMECVRKLEGHSNQVWAITLLSNGNLMSSGSGKEVIIWKPSNDSLFTEEKRISNPNLIFSMIEI